MSKKDKAWEAIFDELNISERLGRGEVVSLTADQIKEITRGTHGVGQQEPRLITKYDTREQRPKVLRDHNCTILATSNGTYSLVSGDGYHDAEEIVEIQGYTSGRLSSLETLPHICTSESQVIDTACASGLLADFLDDDTFSMTIRGRLRSGEFNFNFGASELGVDGVQVEVDAGYEGKRIYLLEAKMGTRDNFITRQLYYPYRMWDARGVRKEIVPIFLSYSDGTFNIYEYAFAEHLQYNSLVLVKSGAYVLQDRAPEAPADDLLVYDSREQLLHVAPSLNEPDAPFPQADDVRKVIDAVFAVASGCTSKPDMADYYDFNARQSDYYGNAARYLGFLDIERRGHFSLSEEGINFVNSSKDERRLMMLRAIMNSPTFNHAVRETVRCGFIPEDNKLALIIRQHRAEINDTTAKRRAHTLHNWLDWVMRKTTPNNQS